MNKTLSLKKLAIDPTAPDAEKEWKFWLFQFQDFDCKTYDESIAKLNEVYVKPKNVIFARYEFISRKQRDGESLEEFLHALQQLSKNCEYKNVTAEQYREEMIRDAFINNMSSNEIRTRLLEHSVISLQETANKAMALNSAKENAKLYTKSDPIIHSVSAADPGIEMTNTSAAIKQECYFCGKRRHPRVNCPTRNTTCNNYGRVGHFAKVCRSASKRTVSISVTSLISSSSSSTATELKNAIVEAKINETNITALIDTGSSLSFIDERLCKTLEMKLLPADGKVLMASTSFQSRLTGCAIELHGFHYSNSKLHVLPNASPFLFANLSTNCKPVAVKSRRYSVAEAKFTNNEVRRLLAQNIIEEICCPWRAQTLVVTTDNHKKRTMIDYSQTINRFTLLDAYPLAKINDMRAYYQIPINARDKPYMAFEAGGRLYQFKRIPFGVTNGATCFQRVMDNILRVEKLKDTFVYVDNPAVDAFKALKKGIVNSVVTAIDDELPFTVETDASDHAIAATLSLLGKPVSFFSRMLSNSEQRHSSAEKKAAKIPQAEQWEEVIGIALHSIRTLLSTATNATPHERLFGYPRRTPTDVRETTGSLRHLTPVGGKCVAEDGSSDETQVGTGAPREEGEKGEKPEANDLTPENSESEEDTVTRDEPHQTPPRRSTRIRGAPQRLQDYVQY
ncbi:Retrovirus-related Pol polyprotein from transposon gypsy [Trichinella murrelli]|uniref:Retrovirus-related Pol polyprotein from transposon gypsy n=1 Tax=Trichinella murrelli TaxID=144512 RepID=A0A0V0TLX1_9BILA|nr:Retrovirus-related Pol polyprotein from transposon gypsy [Trichinella murrelli]